MTNKTDLIAEVADSINVPKTIATLYFDAVTSRILHALRLGDGVVEIKGFGRFSVKDKDAYEGRNPATGEKMMIKASRKVVFKASKGLLA